MRRSVARFDNWRICPTHDQEMSEPFFLETRLARRMCPVCRDEYMVKFLQRKHDYEAWLFDLEN
jgi:hypothetical protein